METRKRKFKPALTPRGRRRQLINYLRKHAAQYNMDDWIVKKPYWMYDTAEEREKAYLIQDKLETALSTGDGDAAMKAFESCGKACCIGGAMMLLSGSRNYAKILRDFGIQSIGYDRNNSDLFYTSHWPNELKNEYDSAKSQRDYCGMVEAGVKAIKLYSIKEG